MSKKIFRSIWFVTLIVFLASLLLIMGALYSYFSGVQRSQLRSQTHLAAQGVQRCGKDYFTDLAADDFRMTWIAADGSILYDTDANADQMENHLQRAEVKEALRDGFGESSRYSSTLSEKQLYAAQRLSDGSVLRLSVVQATVWMLFLGFVQPICIVILLALLLSFLLASRLSKRIMEPFNAIDPEHPAEYLDKEEFREIAPLLHKLDRQQRQLHRDREELEKTSQIRQEFTANVSHELKTPLHAISGYAELLENGMVRPEDIQSFASKIRSQSQRMTKLVEDTIDLTRLDCGGSDMHWEEVDLYRVAENAVDSLEIAAQAANVTITLQGGSAMLRGVAPVLYSMVYNLCDNALKYNHGGGSVTVTVEDLLSKVRLSVADTGIGIPKEHQSRIFERFYRVDKSHSKEVGGTGLGLSLVKHAAQIHHASIQLDSEPDKGSVFTITFPKGE